MTRLTALAGWQVAAGMSVSVWVEIAAAAAGSTIKDSFSVLSEIKGDTFQVSSCLSPNGHGRAHHRQRAL
jgi:hypothetical protein